MLYFPISDYFDPSDEERRRILSQFITRDYKSGLDACKICGMMYEKAEKKVGFRQLQNHIEAIHFRIPAFPCPYCHKIMTSKHKRHNHISATHKEEHQRAKYSHQVLMRSFRQ